MTEIEIDLPNADNAKLAIARIDRAIAAHDLVVKLRGTVKSYPGCTHWHCKNGRETGTLEITYWPAKKRAWFKIQNARRGDWMDAVIASMKRSLESPSRKPG